MPSLSLITNAWGTIKQADLRPVRDQALRGIRIAIVGSLGSGRATLADQMHRDPDHSERATDTPIVIVTPEEANQVAEADLIILMIDSRAGSPSLQERELVRAWNNASKRVIIFINQFPETAEAVSVSPWASSDQGKRFGQRRVVWGSVLDRHVLADQFAPAVIELAPDHLLALGRYFPLFRLPVAHFLINDACFSNAAYSLSTGLAEMIPIMDIPLAMTDMIILTKNQLFLVYKLGLALGYSTEWRDYVTEFGGVLGTGFLWRQMARSLIGLIPVFGIIPKVAVAYAGTYAIGEAVLQWYQTGKHISSRQVQQFYHQALGRGKALARNLLERMPRPRLPKSSFPSLLRLPRPKRSKTSAGQESTALAAQALPAEATIAGLTCPQCGKISAPDAVFCQYCGKSLRQSTAGL